MTDPQTDDTAPTRKRIAVACGRCRKRKIRCSGDPGGGIPCVNCKNAGVDQCLFLRVQSHETAMRDDNRYEYNMDLSRTLAQRGTGSMAHMSSSMAQYPQEIPLLGSGGMPTSYRGSGYPTVHTKGYYYGMGTELADAYGADGSVDYSLSCPPYQVMSSELVQMPVAPGYGSWPSKPKSASQGGGLYLDSDAGYSTYGGGSHTTSLVHRPAVSVAGESSPYSFSGFAASLPSTNASSERLLPTPVSRGISNAASNYRVEGVPTSCYGGSKLGHQSPSVVGATSIQASPTSPIAEVTGYGSSAYDYTTSAAAAVGVRSSHPHPQHQHQHHSGGSPADVYAHVSSGGSETIFADSDRSVAAQGSAVDLAGYTYGAPSSGETSSLSRVSSGSALTSRSTAESSSSSTTTTTTTSSSSGSVTGSNVGYDAGNGGPPSYHTSTTSHGNLQHTHLHHHNNHQHHQHHQHHQQQHDHQHDHHPHNHAAAGQQHHSSPRHGSHHISEQRVVAGGTAYGAGSTSSNGAGSGMGPGGVVGNTAAATGSSHRPSVANRR